MSRAWLAPVDQRLAELRSRLMGGRGPGESPEEVARYTRERSAIGGVPAVLELQLVQEQTQRARQQPPSSWPIDQEGTTC